MDRRQSCEEKATEHFLAVEGTGSYVRSIPPLRRGQERHERVDADMATL